MQSLKPALYLFVTQVTQSVGVYTTLIGIFFYHAVFDKDLECTCKDQTSVCWLYMVLPAFIIFFMLLWLDGSFQVILKSCLKHTGRFRGFLWLWICKAFFISLLWPMSVLIDGDWFICCWHEEKLYCRNLTPEDQKKINELKNTSRIYGFGALLIIIILAASLRFPWKECCNYCGLNKCCTWKAFQKCCSCCFKECLCCFCCFEDCWICESECLNKDDLFKKIVLEEGGNLVTNKMIRVAKCKIDEKIDEYAADGKWKKCFGVVDEITGPPQQHNNPNPQPGGSPSAGERGNGSGEEMQPMVQPPSHELQPVSSSNTTS